MTPTATTTELKTSRGDLESGFYALRDLRIFVAFDGSPADAERVPQWLRSALNPVDRRARHPDYSFGDLISLFVVRELLRKGVVPHTIREAEVWLRRKWKTERPFVSGEIQTDGRGIFVDDNRVAAHTAASATADRPADQARHRRSRTHDLAVFDDAHQDAELVDREAAIGREAGAAVRQQHEPSSGVRRPRLFP